MTTLMQASHQWASRPDDERFASLPEMLERAESVRANSRAAVVSSRSLELIPTTDNKGLEVHGPNGHGYVPTNWSFGQLAQLSESPAGYLRTLPSPLAADCINWGLRYKRGVDDVGVLLYKNGGAPVFRAATGPQYGRVWNSDVVRALINQVGDGVSGAWKVPGEFGEAVTVTKANTTLYASDRDMWVFLADEQNRITVPNRRNGQSGSLARGFFLWNSEEGSRSLGIATFLFDYVCCNRIVWGAEDFSELRIRHTAGAPDRWLEEVRPALEAYQRSSGSHIQTLVVDAQKKRIPDVDDFLAKRFSKRIAEAVQSVHVSEEGRPIESLWDASTAVTAYARGLSNQDARVELERKGGDILALAA